tara:strand:+ start:222 stop:671 length:450 start_codon:yes stop_codon:yes gene_type:complete
MIKFFKLLILMMMFFGCSYVPVHINKDFNFQIIEINFEGEKFINEIIRNKLERNETGEKKYRIYYKTTKIKEIVSSDTKGDPKIFKLKINLEYIVYDEDKKIFENNIIKQISYDSIDDKYELSQYEENILKNLSNKISEDILFSIKLLN